MVLETVLETVLKGKVEPPQLTWASLLYIITAPKAVYKSTT